MADPQYLTTAQAAELVERHRGALHSLASRARQVGTELHAPAAVWPDARTPMWDRDALLRYLSTRPGRGANLRRPDPDPDPEPAPEPVEPVAGQLSLDDAHRSESNGGA